MLRGRRQRQLDLRQGDPALRFFDFEWERIPCSLCGAVFR
ncbi:hypothetical protein CYB_0969 [Synechococcus sp. JA-2-3B'a(2-13)]|nr:hypothetical protein CYB_0969 [Synechococcus sp. JA-2-3B'a(2-13)]